MCYKCQDKFYQLTQGRRLPDTPLICRVFRAWERFYTPILSFARHYKRKVVLKAQILLEKAKGKNLEADHIEKIATFFDLLTEADKKQNANNRTLQYTTK